MFNLFFLLIIFVSAAALWYYLNNKSMALKVIYTIFIGILIAIFVGVGISAFYPSPKEPEPPTMLKLYNLPAEPVKDNKISEKLIKQQEAFDKVIKKYQEGIKIYNRNVSIISLIFAIMILSVSLIFNNRLLIIADGLLLGGVITLLYSIARVFESGDDRLRFVIVGIGLVISLYLGYLRFIIPFEKKGGRK